MDAAEKAGTAATVAPADGSPPRSTRAKRPPRRSGLLSWSAEYYPRTREPSGRCEELRHVEFRTWHQGLDHVTDVHAGRVAAARVHEAVEAVILRCDERDRRVERLAGIGLDDHAQLVMIGAND